MKNVIIFIGCFLCLSVCEAIDFKVDGYNLYYKNSSDKIYGYYDYICIRGVTAETLNSENKPDYIFRDDSPIQKIIQNKYHATLTIYKSKSKWVLFYAGLLRGDRAYNLQMIEPDLESEVYIRNYIKQIYPVEHK